MTKYFALIRISSWIKNLLIFIPIIFSKNLFDFDLLIKETFACIAFCFIASSIYILNDIIDRNKDALHPRKKHRPSVSKAISIKQAIIVFLAMVSSAVFITYHINTEFALMIIAYFSLNLLYSVYFKKINIIELMILSLFFVIRILAGCFAISVVPSEWLITVTFFVALFLVLTKRKSEILILENNAAEHRPVLKMYTLELLNTYTYIVATIILFSYILYTMDPLVIAILNTNKLIYSSIFVTIGLFRVIQISNNKEFDGEGDPTILILKDRYLQIILALWVLSVILFIYIK